MFPIVDSDSYAPKLTVVQKKRNLEANQAMNYPFVIISRMKETQEEHASNATSNEDVRLFIYLHSFHRGDIDGKITVIIDRDIY